PLGEASPRGDRSRGDGGRGQAPLRAARARAPGGAVRAVATCPRAVGQWALPAGRHRRARQSCRGKPADSMAPMAGITVTLPDGTALELDVGASGADAAAAIGPKLARDALAVRVDGELQDLSAKLVDGASIEIVVPGSTD